MRNAVIACLSLLFALGLIAQENSPKVAMVKDVKLQNAQGQDVGSAHLSNKKGGQGVAIKLNLKGLSPGEHAIHVHQAAKCDPPDFKTAGPHFNPENKKHGLENPEGPHAGDMPNFMVKSDGTSKQTIVAKGITLGNGENSVFANGGTALVIHAKADDMKTDPSGNSGNRIACGVITP